jgi:hypothetical protein
MSQVRAVLPLVGFLFILTPVRAETPFRYEEIKLGKAELRYVNGLPVLTVAGTPEEIGEQIGSLMSKRFDRLLYFPREYMKHYGFEALWPTLVKASTQMAAHFPPDHLRELEAMAKRAGVPREVALVGNTFTDIKKVGACSTLIVGPARSATRGPLFGRNLDYPTLGYLQEYTLVTVYRPKGKHAFASIGFPGFLGCLSGINDAGLALATLEVYTSNDDSLRFDPQGTPYALGYRRILEECSTVAEAENLLRSLRRTTRNNLAVCDRTGGVVFEITPKNVVVRRPVDDLCPCTNHFRSKELATRTECKRYRALEKSRDIPKVGLEDMAKLLRAASQPDTLQTMIFEPAELRLHLAIGKVPSSDLEPKELELAPFFKSDE